MMASAAAAPCPANDSTTLVFNSKVYRYIDQNVPYDQAKAKCAALGAYPVVYNTWTEHLVVENYFDHHQDMAHYWLGLRQVGNNGIWWGTSSTF